MSFAKDALRLSQHRCTDGRWIDARIGEEAINHSQVPASRRKAYRGVVVRRRINTSISKEAINYTNVAVLRCHADRGVVVCSWIDARVAKEAINHSQVTGL